MAQYIFEEPIICGNGTKKDGDNRGGTTINISAVTRIGGIQTPNYIACGVCHPREGTLNITGGKFQITNGVGVLIRAGSASITGGEIVTTGSVNGWVGGKKSRKGAIASYLSSGARHHCVCGAADRQCAADLLHRRHLRLG